MGRFLLATLVLAGLLAFAPAATAADEGAEEDESTRPDYPFPDAYRAPKPAPLGTGAGQLRLIGGAGATLGADDTEVVARISLERMFDPWVGLRLSGQTNLATAGAAAPAMQLTTGPTVHTRPYRRLDVAAWVEGGVASRELVLTTSRDRRTGPIVLGGVGLVWTPSAYAFLELGGQYTWSNIEPGSSRRGVEAFIGIGYIL